VIGEIGDIIQLRPEAHACLAETGGRPGAASNNDGPATSASVFLGNNDGHPPNRCNASPSSVFVSMGLSPRCWDDDNFFSHLGLRPVWGNSGGYGEKVMSRCRESVDSGITGRLEFRHLPIWWLTVWGNLRRD